MNTIAWVDMTMMVEATAAYSQGVANAGADDWPSYFVDWRVNMSTFQPFPQTTLGDFFSPRASLGLAGVGFLSTTAPPPTFLMGARRIQKRRSICPPWGSRKSSYRSPRTGCSSTSSPPQTERQ
jgi:hypothetical protein